jgi:hypothetical protein
MCLDISLSPKSFTNNQGLKISYYPITYKNVKASDESNKKMKALERELEKKEMERVKALLAKVNIESDDEELDMDFI